MKKWILGIAIIIIIVAVMFVFAGGAASPQAEEAVAQAVLDRVTGGECTGEGHIILKEMEEDGKPVVYAICSTGCYGFVNGNLEETGGTGAIPTRLTFTVDEYGNWHLVDYWEPVDGDLYSSSLREAFPSYLLYLRASNAEWHYRDLKIQKQKYAHEYLDRIGRSAKVGDSADFGHPLATDQGMSVEASNYLAGEEALGDYPYFLGTEERIENGVRWVYSNEWNPTEGGGTAVYTKTNYETGEIAEKWVYKISGDTCTLTETEKK